MGKNLYAGGSEGGAVVVKGAVNLGVGGHAGVDSGGSEEI